MLHGTKKFVDGLDGQGVWGLVGLGVSHPTCEWLKAHRDPLHHQGPEAPRFLAETRRGR